ncbi:MAG: aminoacyl-tRNA hydrolase [Bacteroidetes bacterium]|nr:aminoacyl-tRNA hydrolase [Bacteroidota bacterium]
MKFLIVGLGNIGAEYANTRHNIGFLVADELALKHKVTFATDRYADKTEFRSKGKTFIVIKPSTYMNLSGNAVRYWMQQEKISIENVLVVTDDLALPFGKVRMRGKGSDGGHNGLKHIQQILNTGDYARIRVGVGKEFAKGQQVDYVLGEWTLEEKSDLAVVVEKAVAGCLSFAFIGLGLTMNTFNSK